MPRPKNAKEVQGFMATLQFMKKGERLAEYGLKPYLYPKGGKEFFVFSIPAQAEECLVQLKSAKAGAAVTVLGFRALLEDGLVKGREQ